MRREAIVGKLRVGLVIGFLACGSDGPNGPVGGLNVQLAVQVVASNLTSPLYLTAPAGDARLFVVEQPGRVVIVQNGQVLATPFLDIRSQVGSGGERGLLGMAFHPNYASNGFFFVSYTDNNGDTQLERYTVSADPNVADIGSAFPIFSVPQPFSNHNGGQVSFGMDGMLYLGLGDGGDGGDPLNSGQTPTTLLGSMLRLDVDGGSPFAVPSDNPFVGSAVGADEVWAYGLRNPWRFSFDPVEGLVYIADVGQGELEEINVELASLEAINYGWNIMEGTRCFNSNNCDRTGLTVPVFEYDHSGGQCSVTGGYVYRGSAIPEIQGHYFYSDFCAGWLRSFRFDSGAAVDQVDWGINLSAVRSFGIDAGNELYILAEDAVYQLVRAN